MQAPVDGGISMGMLFFRIPFSNVEVDTLYSPTLDAFKHAEYSVMNQDFLCQEATSSELQDIYGVSRIGL